MYFIPLSYFVIKLLQNLKDENSSQIMLRKPCFIVLVLSIYGSQPFCLAINVEIN